MLTRCGIYLKDQGRIQDLKLGVVQSRLQILKRGVGGGGGGGGGGIV